MVGWIILLFDKISFYMSFEYFVILGWGEMGPMDPLFYRGLPKSSNQY